MWRFHKEAKDKDKTMIEPNDKVLDEAGATSMVENP